MLLEYITSDLEINGVVVRNVYDTVLVSVEYTLTNSAKAIGKILDKMLEWGQSTESLLFTPYNFYCKKLK